MKILITGIHGFVGTNLVKALKNHNEIFGVDIIAPVKDGVTKTFSWDDVDNNRLPDIDAIIHLAGKAHDVKNTAQAEDYFTVNTGLTQKIYDYFLKSNASKFIFFSSVKAAADSVEGDILDETVVPKPIGPYGESKIKAENYIKQYWQTTDKRSYILRPCMIHGPGNKGNLNLLFSIVNKGIPWPLGAYDNLRSFTSIDNLTFIIDNILNTDIPTGIYNIGDDTPISTNQLIELICQTANRKAHIWKLPKSLMKVLANVGTFAHLPLNNERLRKLTENYCVSNAKIKTQLGIDKLPVDSVEGIRHTLKSFYND